MRAVRSYKVAILTVLLTLCAFVTQGHLARRNPPTPKPSLTETFSSIGAWSSPLPGVMDSGVVTTLKLDDYLFQPFLRGRDRIDLYIGYYRTAQKVGAAHDPLVCFQGQGWELGRRQSGSYRLSRHPEMTVHYATMIAERQGDRELILYWFQAGGEAVSSTPWQKFALLRSIIAREGENNAFVRISAPMAGERIDVVSGRIFSFLEDFYPAFRRYMGKG